MAAERAVYAAIAGNFAVACTKFFAAAITGSSAMLSEAIHSVVDTGDGILLLYGRKQSRKPPDEAHPFGHGQELYFWTLIVSLLIFAAGGAVSAYEGVLHLMNPSPLEDPFWNYVVLGIAACFEGASLVVGMREFRKAYPGEDVWRAVRRSKDPTTFTVVFEDTAALAGLAVAFLGVFLSHRLNEPLYDGSASIVIGGILMAAAILLARESKGLLTGESADPELVRSIRAIAEADPAVERIDRMLTMYFGPDNILLTLDVAFDRRLTSGQVGSAVDRIEKSIRERHPQVKRIFIEAEALTERPERR